MWSRRISKKTITVTKTYIIVIVTVSFAMVLANGAAGLGDQTTETLSDEVKSTEESDGRETPTTETEEADLRLLIPNYEVELETTNRFEGKSGIFPSRMREGEITPDVSVVETTLGGATKAGFIATTSVQGRALPRQSSPERNREQFSGFRQASLSGSQPETTLVSSLAQNLAPRLSSWEYYTSPNSNPRSLPRFSVRSSRGEQFVTFKSSYTTSQEALLTKTSKVFRPQASVFTEKTLLSSATAASPFVAFSQSNFGQANHASQLTTGSSSVTLPLSQWVSRQNLYRMSSLGMKRETLRITEEQKHQTTNVLITETLTLTQNKVSAKTSFRVEDVTAFRSTPAARQTLPDRSRNFQSSGSEMPIPSVITHSISTTLLSRVPLLSSSPVITVEQIHDQFSWSTAALRPETTDKVIKTGTLIATEMMDSVIDYPSVRSSSIPATESVLATSVIYGVIASANSTQLANDKAASSNQILPSSAQTKSKPGSTKSVTNQDSENKVEISSLDAGTSANSRESVVESATVLKLPTDSVTTFQVGTPALSLTVNSTSAIMMVGPSSSLNSSSQIMESTTKYADKKSQSESDVSARRRIVSTMGSSSSLVETFSSKIVIAPSTSSSIKVSSTITEERPSGEGLSTSLSSSVIVSSSNKLTQVSSKSQLLLTPGTTNPTISASSSTNKMSKPSTTTVLLPSLEGLHTSLLSSVVLSAAESLPMSSKSEIFVVVTSPTTSVRGATKSNKVSKFSTTAPVLLPSYEGLQTSLLSTVVVSSTTELKLMPSKSRRLLETSVRGTTKSNKMSKANTTAALLPSQEGLQTSLLSSVVVTSPIEPMLMSSQRFLKSSTKTSMYETSLKPTIAETMDWSQAVKTNKASSFGWQPSVYTSELSGLKSLELSWVTGSPTVTSIQAKPSSTVMNVSRKDATSVARPHNLSSADVRMKLTTASSEHTFATAHLSAAPSSDRVGSASLSPQAPPTVLTTEQPISLHARMSPSSRQNLPLSSRGVKQRTSVSSSPSRNINVDQTNVIPKPSLASKTHQSPSSTSIGIPPSSSLEPKLKSTNSSHMTILIVVATVPSVFLGIIIGLLICRHRGRHKSKGTRYSIKVEYTDEVRRRPRKRTNSRLDLAVHGIHIDLEFPTSADARDSVRISRGTHLSEGQIRELQLLSQECNQRLEWLNEVLAKEVVSPFSGTDSGILFRDSTFESGGKIVRRESSKRSRDNFKLKRLFSRDRDSSAEYGEDPKKETIEFKALPASSEETPNNTLSKNCKGVEDSKKDGKLSPEGETTETGFRSAENETEEDNDSSSGNKIRYYPLARTRDESKRSRFETL